MLRTPRRLAVAVVALAAVLTGCSEPGAGADQPVASPQPLAQTPGPFGESDVTFAAQLVSQHQRGVDLASSADSRAANAELKAWAKRFVEIHEPEIAQASELLESWGQTPPEDPGLDSNRPGKVTDADVGGLTALSGTAYDKRFVELMIRHHEGVIETAAKQAAAGKNPRARELAGKLDRSQRDEVTQLKALGV
jgi:uncharacterized protein (DUF305 family)